MNPRIPIQAEHVLVVGVGVSGQATIRYLLAHADIIGMRTLTLVDSAKGKALDAFVAELTTESVHDVHIRTYFGVTTVPSSVLSKGSKEACDDKPYGLCIITPGLAPHTALSKSAYQNSREVLSEIELAYRLSDEGITWIAITGTNGKTTTVELTQSILAAAAAPGRVYSVGNIGLPALAVLDSARAGDYLVAEVSSFQAARLEHFRPQVAALLNLSSDHLDWHSDIARYARDKCAIFANSAQGDFLLMPELDQLHSEARPVIQTAVKAAVSRGVTVKTVVADSVCLPLRAEELKIAGKHNVINACFAAEIARFFGVSDSDIARTLQSYQASPHRMQEVGSYCDVLYVNDSKATNPDATIQALTAYPGQEIILLLGGQSKGADYLDLAKVARGRTKMILCFGQARQELKATFDVLQSEQSDTAVTFFDHMLDAVSYARKHAVAGQVVLLSPANASFDEFDDYAARGEAFAKAVKAYEHV